MENQINKLAQKIADLREEHFRIKEEIEELENELEQLNKFPKETVDAAKQCELFEVILQSTPVYVYAETFEGAKEIAKEIAKRNWSMNLFLNTSSKKVGNIGAVHHAWADTDIPFTDRRELEELSIVDFFEIKSE